MSRKDDILAFCGLTPPSLAIATNQDDARWEAAKFPAPLPCVKFFWPWRSSLEFYTDPVADVAALGPPTGCKIAVVTNEYAQHNHDNLKKLADQAIYMAGLVRAAGWSPGVYAVGPWGTGYHWTGISDSWANTYLRDALSPHIDWYFRATYGGGKEKCLSALLTTMATFGAGLTSTLIRPYDGRWATYIEWAKLLEISHRADLTVLWNDARDRLPGIFAEPGWVRELDTLDTFGLPLRQPWLQSIIQ